MLPRQRFFPLQRREMLVMIEPLDFEACILPALSACLLVRCTQTDDAQAGATSVN